MVLPPIAQDEPGSPEFRTSPNGPVRKFIFPAPLIQPSNVVNFLLIRFLQTDIARKVVPSVKVWIVPKNTQQDFPQKKGGQSKKARQKQRVEKFPADFFFPLQGYLPEEAEGPISLEIH